MKTKFLNAVCKTRYLALLVVLIFTCGNVWGANKTITLTYNSFSLTTSYAKKTATVSSISFTVDQGYKGTGNVIQMNSSKGSGILYNTTAIKGLKSIAVTVSSGEKTYTITTGTSEKPSANSQTGTTTKTFNAKSGDTYFQLKVSGASYFSQIVITYDDDATKTVYIQNNCSDGNSYSISGAGSSTGTYGGWADTYSVSANTEITLGYTTGTGQTFDGWDGAVLDENSSPITVTNNKVTVTKDVYVYCNFSASCTNGTVSYAKGSITYTGGNEINGSHANSTKVCNANLTLPDVVFTTTGYTQDGWATSDGGSKAYNLSATNYATEGDATLYPHWTANTYTVLWSVNESVTSTTPGVSYNTTTSTPANPSVPDECAGLVFRGWTATANYEHATNPPGDMFNTTTPAIKGNITFHAVFAEEE